MRSVTQSKYLISDVSLLDNFQAQGHLLYFKSYYLTSACDKQRASGKSVNDVCTVNQYRTVDRGLQASDAM
jgi:hypothetical protein